MKRTSFALTLALSLSTFAYAQQPQAAPQGTKKLLTVETMFADMGAMATAPQSLQWSPDGTKISFIQHGKGGEQESLYYFDPATGKSSVLVASDRMASLNGQPPTGGKGDDRFKDNRARYGVAAYHWAPNSQSILFDRMGQLWLYDLKTNTGIQVTSSPETKVDPKFSPDAKFVSYVREHNLYIKPLAGREDIALTKTADPTLLNGEVDWVYSEELDVRTNYHWSPDSKHILFLQMNEAPVPTYPITDWIPTHPNPDEMRYPKAGDPNPTVKLAVADLKGKVKWLPITQETDIYIPRFGWVKPGLAWAMVLNRNQNKQDLYLIDVVSGKTKQILSEKEETYIEINDNTRFLKSGTQFIWPSWRDGHTHLYLYSIDAKDPLKSEAKLEKQLTQGEFEVSKISGIDEANKTVYFTANKGDSRQMQVFSVKFDGSELKQVSKEQGVHDATMSDDTKYFVDRYSSLTTQPRMQICGTTGQCNEIWRSTAMDAYDLLTPQFVDFKAEDGTVLHGALLLPPAGAPGTVNGKYPLILNPYGGPHGQSARDASTTMGPFDQILARKGYAVLKVDNRGMGNRGRKFATATYKNLGEIELKDQLAALDQALAQFPQLDGTRLGFWGWSYGGSMTLNALTHSDRFKVGVSVAPVTDWRNYDSIYTERYMALPKDNQVGYDKGALVKSAANLKGNLMIVHGTSDDNVHMQNTIQFINELISNGKQFCLQLYPQKTHSISGQKARTHLYTRILMQFDNGLMK